MVIDFHDAMCYIIYDAVRHNLFWIATV